MRRYCHPEFRGREWHQEVDFCCYFCCDSAVISSSQKEMADGPIQRFICQAFTLAELITIGEQIMRVEPSGRGCIMQSRAFSSSSSTSVLS